MQVEPARSLGQQKYLFPVGRPAASEGRGTPRATGMVPGARGAPRDYEPAGSLARAPLALPVLLSKSGLAQTRRAMPCCATLRSAFWATPCFAAPSSVAGTVCTVFHPLPPCRPPLLSSLPCSLAPRLRFRSCFPPPLPTSLSLSGRLLSYLPLSLTGQK